MNFITTLKWIVAMAVLALVLRSMVVFVFEVENSFMEPSLKANQIVIGSRWAYGIRFPWTDSSKLETIESENPPQVNDLIAIEFKHQPGLIFLKRVIAVPGDRVKVSNGVLEINGKTCLYNSEANGGFSEKCVNGERNASQFKGDTSYGEKLLADGEYLVLYDNREFEEDLSLYGTVNFQQILGKVFWKF
jgi:signal peptidase I